MTRTTVPLGALCTLLATLLLGAAPVSAAAPADPVAGLPSRLVEVRAAHHPGYDRLVFEFSGAVPATHTVEWTDQLWWDTAGPDQRAWVSGNAFLRIRLFPVLVEDQVGATADRALDLANLVEARRIGAWEGYETWGVGVLRRTSVLRLTVLRDPGRLVVDVAADMSIRFAPILFLDREADRWTWVDRAVPAAGGPVTHVRDALRRLLAGPTLEERAAGLRLVRDHVVSFRALTVSPDGVASFKVVGACDSGGARRTLGTELIRTLKAIDGIRLVKVFDNDGHTRSATDGRDSLPPCLGG
ncbi:MAG: hypothetical protein U0869_19060 [Chloroflexota bacterium]